jgi:hypothetical protein
MGAAPGDSGAKTAKLSPLPVKSGTDPCDLRATADLGVPGWKMVADSKGKVCADADVTIYVVAPGDGVAFSETYKASDLRVVFGEAAETPATDPVNMQVALSFWITPPDGGENAGDLPAFGAEQEFPFFPEEGLNQAAYEKMRSDKVPMVCFVQGGESERCLVIDAEAGIARDIGVRTFPG